jgi:predicted MFS family arabinose efflux permease
MEVIIQMSNDRTQNKRAWFMLLLSSLFVFYQCLLRTAPSAMSLNLMSDFSVTEHRVGFLSAAFFLSYTLIQVPAGILLDHFKPRRLLSWACLLCAMSSIFFALAPYFIVASISRLFMGLGGAFAFIGSLKLAANWFPAQRFTLLAGIVTSISLLGTIAGEAPLTRLVENIGWRHSMLIIGVLGILISLLFFMFLKDSQTGSTVLPKKSFNEHKQTFMRVIKSKQLWMIAGYSSFVSMPVYTLSTLWGVPFLMARYNLSELIASRTIALCLIGVIVGGPFWGAISDHFKRRFPPLVIAAIGPALALILVIYYPFSDLIIPRILLFSFGFFTSAYLASLSIAREINHPEHTGMALAFINMTNMLAVTLSLPLLGRVLDIFWSGTTKHGLRIYSLSDYQVSMMCMVAVIIISIFFLVFIKETYAKSLLAEE